MMEILGRVNEIRKNFIALMLQKPYIFLYIPYMFLPHMLCFICFHYNDMNCFNYDIYLAELYYRKEHESFAKCILISTLIRQQTFL